MFDSAIRSVGAQHVLSAIDIDLAENGTTARGRHCLSLVLTGATVDDRGHILAFDPRMYSVPYQYGTEYGIGEV